MGLYPYGNPQYLTFILFYIVKIMDVFADSIFHTKVKVKTAKICSRGVLEIEASPQRPHPWSRHLVYKEKEKK